MNIENLLPALIPHLKKFALLQLRNEEAANDVVQETCLSAIQNQHSFKGDSELKTWLIAILKNKIIDYLRSENRKITVTVEDFDADDYKTIRVHVYRPSKYSHGGTVAKKKNSR